MIKYFTIQDEKTPPAQVPEGVTLDVIGLRESITDNPEFKKRAIATTFNMFFKKGFTDITYVAAGAKLTKDPRTLYDVKEADATVFRMEKVMEMKDMPLHAVWDVAPPSYAYSNCIMIRNKEFAKEWLEMTAKVNLDHYKGWEMDVLNMLTYYGDYRVRVRDISEL